MKEKYDKSKEHKSLSEINAGESNVANVGLMREYRDWLEDYLKQGRTNIQKEQEKLDEFMDNHKSQKK